MRFKTRHLLLLVAGCGLACLALMPAREPSYQRRCQANLRAIGVALRAYHAAHGCFPPAYTVGALNGRLAVLGRAST